MKVYLDLVFLLNFLFDFILLASVNYIVRRNKPWYRLFFSSLLGTFTLIFLFFDFPYIVTFFYKVFLSFLMLFVAFGFQDIQYFFKNVLYFYLVSMLLGGSVTFLQNQFSYTNEGLVFTAKGLGMSYFVVLLLSVFLFFKYMKSFHILKNHYANYYRCDLYFDEKQYVTLNAFLDTGNKIKDPYSHHSVVLVNEKCLPEFRIRSPIYVPFSTLNSKGILECFRPFKIVIEGKETNSFLVGLSRDSFFIDGVDCIINNQIMEGLK